MTQANQEKALLQIAEKVVQTAYRSLILEMRFLDVALAQLKPTPSTNTEYLGTNGTCLFYNPGELARRYRQNPCQVNQDVVHVLLHCIFRHLFFKSRHLPYWDLACDITVQQLISTMDTPCLTVVNPEAQSELSKMEAVISQFSPHSVMSYLQLRNLTEGNLQDLTRIFQIDNHAMWDEPPPLPSSSQGAGAPRESDESLGQSKESAGSQNSQGETEEQNTPSPSQPSRKYSKEAVEKKWSEIGRKIGMNMDSFGKKQGDMAGNFRQKLKQVTREAYDYSKFLKKFAQRQEVNKVNHDEFDYIFYTYGLNLYKNMPLIEPLEYRDNHVIKDFVVAIDTSGSTSGDLVQKFLQKTYDVLKNTESFAQKFNLYIIQCDATIQEVAHITSQEQLDDYIQNLVLKGLGGTDFRPVFEYVQELLSEETFEKLKGLIYFTDGYGTFPTEKTPYDTAFVFVVPEDYETVTVPPWAMKVLLTEQEIKEFQEKEGE